MSIPTRALIVDDDPIFLAVSEAVIRELGVPEVIGTDEPDYALIRLKDEAAPVDCLILDLNMPRMDGLAFLRAAAEANFAGDVIIASGESQAIRRSAEHIGNVVGTRVLGSISKPISPQALHELFSRRAEGTGLPRSRHGQASNVDPESAELVPYYQGQYSISSGALAGLEALIRVRTIDGRIHGPATIGSAELSRLSYRIALRILDDLQTWNRNGYHPRVAINFDAKFVEAPGTAEALLNAVRERALNPSDICIELTETSLPAELSRLMEVLTRLRMLGFELSIDDYGTGSSNFELLRLCPFSELKLDRKIVQASVVEVPTRRFIEAAVLSAHDLGLRVIAEGVETQEELEVVKLAGADLVQGYLFSRPEPADRAFANASSERRESA